MTTISNMTQVSQYGFISLLNNESGINKTSKAFISSLSTPDYIDFSKNVANDLDFQKISDLQSDNQSNYTHQAKISVSNFTKTLLEYLENQDDLMNNYHSKINDISNSNLISNGLSTVTSNDGKKVTISSLIQGNNIELLLPNGNKIVAKDINTDVRFSTQQNGEIVMATRFKTITFDAQGNKIREGEGDEPLLGTDSDDIIINFYGSNIDGGDGNDLIINFAAQSTITGGTGNDKVIIANSIANSTGSILNIDLGDGDDSLIISDMHDASKINIQGGNGNDNIQIGTIGGSSTELNIDGGNGDDEIIVNHAVIGAAKISGNDGNDKIRIKNILVNNGENAVISGAAGNDDISIDFMHGVEISGEKGNDTIKIGIAGNSIIDCGDGNNEITIGTMIRSLLINGDGSDVISIDTMLQSIIASRKNIDSFPFEDSKEEEGDNNSLHDDSVTKIELYGDINYISKPKTFGDIIEKATII